VPDVAAYRPRIIPGLNQPGVLAPEELLLAHAFSTTYGSPVPWLFDPRMPAGWLLLRRSNGVLYYLTFNATQYSVGL